MNAAAESKVDVLPLRSDDDVVRVRTRVRQEAVTIGLSLVDQTKLVTAASELARNTLRYGGGGEAQLQLLTLPGKCGIRLIFSDSGPGIADITLALTDGFTTGGGLGLGLGGAKRLVDEFSLVSEVGVGTAVEITKWKSL